MTWKGVLAGRSEHADLVEPLFTGVRVGLHGHAGRALPAQMIGPAIPGSGPDEYTACVPFRAVVPVWSAVVRRGFIVSVRTNGRLSDADRNLGGCGMAAS
jgi:hypothetical protein